MFIFHALNVNENKQRRTENKHSIERSIRQLKIERSIRQIKIERSIRQLKKVVNTGRQQHKCCKHWT